MKNAHLSVHFFRGFSHARTFLEIQSINYPNHNPKLTKHVTVVKKYHYAKKVKWQLVNKFQRPVNGDIYISLINFHPVVNDQMLSETNVAWGKEAHEAYVDF